MGNSTMIRHLVLGLVVFYSATSFAARPAPQPKPVCDENVFSAYIMVPGQNSSKSPTNPLPMHQSFELMCTHSRNWRTLYNQSLKNVEAQHQLALQFYAAGLIRENEKNYYVSLFAETKKELANCKSHVRNMNRPLRPFKGEYQIEYDDPFVTIQWLQNGQVVRGMFSHKVYLGLLLWDEGFNLCDGRIVNRPPQEN